MSDDPKKKFGDAKPQLHMIPPAAKEATARALELGAKKYGERNWMGEKVSMTTYLSAAQRHLDCIMDGEDIDPESGVHHLGHVMAGCAIVLDALRHGMLIDNRVLPPKRGDKTLEEILEEANHVISGHPVDPSRHGRHHRTRRPLPQEWKLPEPPPGRKWYRGEEFGGDMVPPTAHRPILIGEVPLAGDKYWNAGKWMNLLYSGTEVRDNGMYFPLCTPRPLPQEDDDIPVGMQ